MLILESDINQQMLDDARQAFPNECCGFLFGIENGRNRLISDILVVKNSKEGDQRRRFEITPRDYLRAEKFAVEKGLDLLGVYHSHPNHLAIPSEHDRVAAQPFFSYVIVSIFNDRKETTLSWRLNEKCQFEEELLQVQA